MPMYDVPIVRRELLSLWHEFWDGPEPTERASQADRDGSLSHSETIIADSATEAATLAERKHPDCVAIREHVRKLPQ